MVKVIDERSFFSDEKIPPPPVITRPPPQHAKSTNQRIFGMKEEDNTLSINILHNLPAP